MNYGYFNRSSKNEETTHGTYVWPRLESQTFRAKLSG